MKVAIIHDVFIEFGGAERVLYTLLELYPEADVYIPLLSDRWIAGLKTKIRGKIISSFFNHIPFIHSASILLKPLLYLYWEQLDLSMYGLVISSSHSFSSKSVITATKTLHVSYIHTPPRYLYTEYNETRVFKNPVLKVLLSPVLSWLRVRDFIGAQRPDILIANSKTVQARIKKYYRRESTVIYPPVNIPKQIKTGKRKYFLCVSRLARQKGTDLAIKACNKLHLPLWIVGTGTQEAYLRSIAGPTVRFKGWVPDEKMDEIYAHAKALIYCSIDEDFGIVPVEAMAHGVPVVAYDSGATRETITDGITGLFFHNYSEDSLKQILSVFNKKTFDSGNCIKQARIFSKTRFTTSINHLITSQIYYNRNK